MAALSFLTAAVILICVRSQAKKNVLFSSYFQMVVLHSSKFSVHQQHEVILPWLLLQVRIFGVTIAHVTDCDEVYNYWEPLHFLLYGSGSQTWEYSPIYALRSYVWMELSGTSLYNCVKLFHVWIYTALLLRHWDWCCFRRTWYHTDFLLDWQHLHLESTIKLRCSMWHGLHLGIVDKFRVTGDFLLGNCTWNPICWTST